MVRLAEEALECSGSRHVAQPGERFLFDLTNSLARDPEERSDLLQRHRLLTIQTEVQPQDLRLALLQARLEDDKAMLTEMGDGAR